MSTDHRSSSTHTRRYPTFTKEELLAFEYTPGGMVRHTVIHPDGLVESVGLNNLVAVVSRFCTDPLGNHFGAYFIVPESYWKVCCGEVLEKLGRGVDTLPNTKDGGVLGLIANCTIYHGGTDLVLMRADHNELCWSFDIGDQHKLHDRNAIRELVGPNKNFDLEFPFFPGLDWAPIPLIQEWAAKGLLSAQRALDNPELYLYWERKQLEMEKRKLLEESVD